MDFREMVNSDIDEEFLNLEEFGESVKINGENVVVVMDDEELERRNRAMQVNSEVGKLSKGEVLFYVKKSFFEHIPQTNKIMDFNGKKYRIDTASIDMGILTIVLSRYTG